MLRLLSGVIALGAFLASIPAMAQTKGTPVSVIPYPLSSPTQFLDYDGSGNLIYVCSAAPNGPTTGSTQGPYTYSLSVTGGGLTSIVVLTNVGTVTTVAAHGLMVGQPVTVSGSTTSALNASYRIATVPSTTTFTIATSGVGDATYNNGPLTISGNAPLLTAAIWTIEKINYDGSNRAINVQWAGGNPGTYNKICANRAAASITYK